MVNQFLDYHKNKPIVFELPIKGGSETIEVYLTDKIVADDYSDEYYFCIELKGREKFKNMTDKMIEHYVYNSFKQYLKLFSIDGDIFLKFKY